MNTSSAQETRTLRVFLIRGVIAIAWAVIAVFGVWAAVSGAAQLVVVLRRRAQLGNQWPLLLANGVSVIGGVAFLIAAAVGHPNLSMLAIYAATGGVEFVIQA
jgi:uncharacterized membrane protein HdeD (DUF308 family)